MKYQLSKLDDFRNCLNNKWSLIPRHLCSRQAEARIEVFPVMMNAAGFAIHMQILETEDSSICRNGVGSDSNKNQSFPACVLKLGLLLET